jgi:hypothetical protein
VLERGGGGARCTPGTAGRGQAKVAIGAESKRYDVQCSLISSLAVPTNWHDSTQRAYISVSGGRCRTKQAPRISRILVLPAGQE